MKKHTILTTNINEIKEIAPTTKQLDYFADLFTNIDEFPDVYAKMLGLNMMLNNLDRIKDLKPENQKYVLLHFFYDECNDYKEYEDIIDFDNAIELEFRNDYMTLVPYFENCENTDLIECVLD